MMNRASKPQGALQRIIPKPEAIASGAAISLNLRRPCADSPD